MIKKILYVAFKYEYGLKSNGLALNYKAWFETFISLGYQLDSIFFEDLSHSDLQAAVVERSLAFEPDLVFFILQKEQIEVSTLLKLREHQFTTACFFGDDQWRFDGWTSKYAPYLSVCITTDKFSIDKYKSIGQNNIIYSQWASLESSVDPNDYYQYEVSFVGGINSYRKWFVSFLKKKGIAVECFGSGWKKGRVTYQQMGYIFSSSKISINISNSANYDLRHVTSSPKALLSSLKAYSTGRGKFSSQIKARNFEIPAQAGFQLTDYVPTLEEYFTIGKEVVCYSNVDEAEKLIKYYLTHESERESIKQMGTKRARSEHLFSNRIRAFMGEIENICAN